MLKIAKKKKTKGQSTPEVKYQQNMSSGQTLNYPPSGTRDPTTPLKHPETYSGSGSGANVEATTQHYAEKLKDAKDTAQHTAREAIDQYVSPSTRESMRVAAVDTRSYLSRHPYILPVLLLMSMLLGFAIGSMTTGSVWAASSLFGGYSRGSPEYEAHKKLDHILRGMYGNQPSYMEKFGMSGRGGESSMFPSMWGGERSHGGNEGFLEKIGLRSGGSGYGQHPGRGSWFGGSNEGSRTDEALSYMGDTLRNVKERISPSQHEQSGIGHYMSEYLPTGFGGRSSDEYQYQKPHRSMMDKVKGLYSKSEWEKVDEAERKLREALQAASQRGEL